MSMMGIYVTTSAGVTKEDTVVSIIVNGRGTFSKRCTYVHMYILILLAKKAQIKMKFNLFERFSQKLFVDLLTNLPTTLRKHCM